jgi:hypothetical protein
MALPRAFYLNCDPCREQDMSVCVPWLADQVNNGGGSPIVVTPVLSQVEQVLSGVPGLAGVIGASISTYRKTRWQGGPVLAVWPDKKMLTTLDDDYRVTAICAVPWALPSIMEWIKAGQAIDLLGKAQTSAAPRFDPVVEQALESLTISVNLSTALANPIDKTAAVTFLRVLHRARYKMDPGAILAWAMSHGWSARGAQELSDVARGVLEGRAYRVVKNAFRSDAELIAHWKERAAKKKDG